MERAKKQDPLTAAPIGRLRRLSDIAKQDGMISILANVACVSSTQSNGIDMLQAASACGEAWRSFPESRTLQGGSKSKQKPISVGCPFWEPMWLGGGWHGEKKTYSMHSCSH